MLGMLGMQCFACLAWHWFNGGPLWLVTGYNYELKLDQQQRAATSLAARRCWFHRRYWPRPGGATINTASVLSSLVIQLLVVTAMGRVAATYMCEQGVFGAGPKEIESVDQLNNTYLPCLLWNTRTTLVYHISGMCSSSYLHFQGLLFNKAA